MRILRCPSCRAYLSTSRTIDTIFRHSDKGHSWSYRLACGNCLAIARLERTEMGKDGRTLEPPPTLEIAAAVVVRAIERLREAEAAGDLAGEVVTLCKSEYRVLVRVPEVLAVARPAWGRRVKLKEAAYFQSTDPLHGGAADPEGRIELRDAGRHAGEGMSTELDLVRETVALMRAQLKEDTPAAVVLEQGVVMVLPETEFAVQGCDGGSFLLEPHLSPMMGAPMSLSRLEAFTASGDLLDPAAPPP